MRADDLRRIQSDNAIVNMVSMTSNAFVLRSEYMMLSFGQNRCVYV